MSPLRVSLTGVCFRLFLEELSITENFKRCNFVFSEEKSLSLRLLLENYCVSRYHDGNKLSSSKMKANSDVNNVMKFPSNTRL